jgi:hypothetical protein
MQATSYDEAITMIVRTPAMIEAEMDSPLLANHAQFSYQMPNGVKLGVGKSQRPGHASLFQIIVTDFDGKNAFKTETEYSGEYTSSTRAEKHLRSYIREAWTAAEKAKAQAERAAQAAAELKAMQEAEYAEAEQLATEEKARIDALALELAETPDVAEVEDDTAPGN